MGEQRGITRTPKDPGPAAWREILGELPGYPRLEGDHTADWLVIGGGYAGLSAARRLGQLRGGDKVILLEASLFGAGPAGRNSGFMIDLPHDLGNETYASSLEVDRKQIMLNRHAISFARAAAEEYDMPEEAVAPTGRINGATGDAGEYHNRSYKAHLKNLDEPYEMLSADDMERITGTTFYSSGMFLPGAVLLQPALYITRLAAGIHRQHAPQISLHENSPVLSYTRQGSDWRVVTPNGSVTAPKIILAVNGHAQSFGFFKGRLMHVFTYASMTEPLTDDQIKRLGGERRWGVTPSDPMGSSLRRISGIGGDRITVRNRWTYDASMEVPEERVARFGRDQDESFRRRFASIGEVRMAYRWAGRLCLSRNSVPAFGEVEDGIISACCQNGLGTAKGTLAGIGAVDLATRANSEIVDDMLSYDAPQKLPPEPLASIGANLFLRWREFKARHEL
ncbi:MAG: NAD(P)/FAD-dependent oxidoreductase [Candidatus Puniceispirillales bacterium]